MSELIQADKYPYLRAGFMLGVQDGVICLVDRCNELGTMTITNDAENVIRYLKDAGIIADDSTLVIYKDTEGIWDQLLHLGGKFAAFISLGGQSEMKAAVSAVKRLESQKCNGPIVSSKIGL